MKSKLLKRLRKRYTWIWIPAPKELLGDERFAHWQILDHYNQQVFSEKSAYEFLKRHVVYDIYGTFSGIKYEKQHRERENRSEYRQAKAALNK